MSFFEGTPFSVFSSEAKKDNYRFDPFLGGPLTKRQATHMAVVVKTNGIPFWGR